MKVHRVAPRSTRRGAGAARVRKAGWPSADAAPGFLRADRQRRTLREQIVRTLIVYLHSGGMESADAEQRDRDPWEHAPSWRTPAAVERSTETHLIQRSGGAKDRVRFARAGLAVCKERARKAPAKAVHQWSCDSIVCSTLIGTTDHC